jgi:hypothetical protein
LVTGAAKLSCSLLNSKKTIEKLDIEITKSYKVFTFKNLIPATEYTVQLVIQDSEVAQLISFSTLQDYPQSTKNITLVANDKILSADSLFTLNIAKPENLGYWESDSGYDILLIVNNKIVKTINVANANQNIAWSNFSIKSKFGYQCKTGDSVQIGARVWTKDSSGVKLYNSYGLNCSKPICLLNKSVSLYLPK